MQWGGKHADGEIINALLCVLDRGADGSDNCYQITNAGAVTFAPADYPLELHLSTFVAPSLEVEEPVEDAPVEDAPAESAPTTADAGIVAAAAVMAVAAGVVLSKKH